MGRTYEQMDKQENAIRAFQQVCRDYPRSGHASEAHAHLQNKYKINVTLGGAKED
jgi:outer membrane protein assembly factor BamD (BamD/ComL family)